MPTRNVVVTEHQSAFIKSLVSSGRYQHASEVMREGIRLVERQEAENEARLEAMGNVTHAGIADIAEGRSREFDGREALSDHLAGLTEGTLGGQPLQVDGGRGEFPPMADTRCRRRPPVP